MGKKTAPVGALLGSEADEGRKMEKGQTMKPYARLSANPGVTEYDDGPDFIRVRFAERTIYTYTNSSAGPSAVQEMNRLAEAGKGLSTYIAHNDPPYESKTG